MERDEDPAAALLSALQLFTGQSVILSDAIARAAKLNRTDLEALGAIHASKATSAGDLATATGLTTGAITAVIDRLERAGYVIRASDPADRRKVLVKLQPEKAAEVEKHYASLGVAMRLLIGTYSHSQIELVARFLRESTKLAAVATANVTGTKLNGN